ncbi:MULTISPECIES: hypothetical protein [unclassified Microcoleus]
MDVEPRSPIEDFAGGRTLRLPQSSPDAPNLLQVVTNDSQKRQFVSNW